MKKYGILILSLVLYLSTAVMADNKKFQGLIGIYNGAVRSNSPMYAVHKTLPKGTKLSITNFANGKTTQVTVVAQADVHKGRVLEISKTAATELGFANEGVAYADLTVTATPKGQSIKLDNDESSVNTDEDGDNDENTKKAVVKKQTPEEMEDIEKITKDQDVENDTKKVSKVIGDPDNIHNNTKTLNVNRIFVVQFGAFSTMAKAKNFQDVLASKGIKTYVAKEGKGSQELYKVREATIYRDLQEVFSHVIQYKKQGFRDCFAVGKFFISGEGSETNNISDKDMETLGGDPNAGMAEPVENTPSKNKRFTNSNSSNSNNAGSFSNNYQSRFVTDNSN